MAWRRFVAAGVAIALSGVLQELAAGAERPGPSATHRCHCPKGKHECACPTCRSAGQEHRRAGAIVDVSALPPCHRAAALAAARREAGETDHLPAGPGLRSACESPEERLGAPPGREPLLLAAPTSSLPALAGRIPPAASSRPLERSLTPEPPPPRPA